jgi:hypothetical protein
MARPPEQQRAYYTAMHEDELAAGAAFTTPSLVMPDETSEGAPLRSVRPPGATTF